MSSHIPFSLLTRILADSYYKTCARASHECKGRITFEHAFLYAGKQINELWAIIPLCVYHHLGDGLVKTENERIAMSRATEEDKKKYPRLHWAKKYGTNN